MLILCVMTSMADITPLVTKHGIPGASAGIIDEMKSVKHSRLSQRIEEAITDPAKCQVTGLIFL